MWENPRTFLLVTSEKIGRKTKTLKVYGTRPIQPINFINFAAKKSFQFPKHINIFKNKHTLARKVSLQFYRNNKKKFKTNSKTFQMFNC